MSTARPSPRTRSCAATAEPRARDSTPRAAERCVDLPNLRAALLARYGGADDAGFEAYLHERHLDRHYRPLPHARPFSLGVGNLWRLAVRFPGSPVPACIHRAPPQRPGDPRRLLLIS